MAEVFAASSSPAPPSLLPMHGREQEGGAASRGCQFPRTCPMPKQPEDAKQHGVKTAHNRWKWGGKIANMTIDSSKEKGATKKREREISQTKGKEAAAAMQLQSPKKWLVCGLVKFATAVARLVCPDLLG